MPEKENSKITLIVLSHGLWGVKGHLGYIEKGLKDKYKDTIHVLNSSANESKYTYDGVDICGERLADDIETTVVYLGKKGQTVANISFIGYSLGGLIIRYAIGVLGERNFFNAIQQDYFITFATPHMGCKLPSRGVLPTIFKFISGRLVSRSGEQIQLIDKHGEKQKHLLEVLSDPDQPYYEYLAKFKYRRSYANVANDRTVPYWTAGMELRDFFYDKKGKLDITMDEKYIAVITSFDLRVPGNKRVPTAANQKTKSIRSTLIRCAFYCLFPILYPIIFIFAFSLISIQGLISRYRVHKLLSAPNRLTHSKGKHHTNSVDRYVDGEILAGALDAVNLPGDDSASIHQKRSTTKTGTDEEGITHKKSNDDYYYKVYPSKLLDESSKPLEFDETTKRIHKNLNQLEWQKVWVFIRAYNAHGSIVCRAKRFMTIGGESVVQHFLDNTHFTNINDVSLSSSSSSSQ